MDEEVFASLAQISILVIPVGNIQQRTFDRWAAEVCKFEEIRLGDIPSGSKDERARFMPSPLANGFLNLSYVSRPPPHSRSQMTLFRPSTFPLGVVGIASCSQPEELQAAQAHFKASISNLFPPGTLYPLARSCFVFEDGRSNTSLDIGKSLPDLYIIPSMMGNKQIYIGTLLAELCSTILGEFSTITQMLETPIGNEALNATLFGELPGASDPASPTETSDVRPTSQPTLPTQKAHTDLLNTSQSRDTPPIVLKRSSTFGPGSMPTRSSTLLQPATRKRTSAASSSASAARLYKVLGDLFLLSGRTMDATIWFTEAIVLLKQSQDFLWHASALEGIATALVIDAFTANHSESTPKEPWSEIADKMSQAVSLYQKLLTMFEDDDTNGNIARVYISSALRHSLLYFCIWASGGWGPQAFSAMLHPSSFQHLIASVGAESSTTPKLDRLAVTSRVTRELISSVLTPAHGPWILHLGPKDRVDVLRTMAKLYAAMGFRRKECYVLRELIGCVMDILAVGREERPPQLTPSLESLRDGLQTPAQGGDIGLRESEDMTGNDSIVRLIKRTCEVLGVDLTVVNFSRSSDSESLLPKYFTQQLNDSDTAYGWPPLQTAVVQEMMYIAEALPDYPSVVTFGLSALCSMRTYLDGDAQYRLYTTTARAMSTARRRGVPLELEFWPGNLLTGISFTPLHFTRAPIDIKVSSIRRVASESGKNAATVDPFLYNPRRASTEKQRSLIAQNEEVEFIVELSNPYFVTLELQQILLSTSGVDFESTPAQLLLPANSTQSIALKGKAKQQGTLLIRGCVMQLPGTSIREAILPLLKEDEKVKQLRRLSAVTDSKERLKHKGLDAWLRRGHRSTQIHQSLPAPPQLQFVELKVIPEQPLLRIRRTSLTHGAVMLYEGETAIIRLTLENISSITVDLLQLNVGDSTKDRASSALAEGNLSPLAAYETEYELVNKPVLALDTDLSGKEIPPGEETVVALRCFGKAGCISGTIQFQYGNTRELEKPDVNADIFHGRQLIFPVLITVYQILECHSLDISPLTSMDVQTDVSDMDTKSWNAIFKNVNACEWCLFSIHVTNNYNLPFEVTLSYHTSSDDISSAQLIPPGSTYRLIVPVRRFRLPQTESAAPIPSLTNRQFVLTEPVATNDALQRELFWYQERLMQNVRLEWKESGGSRCGELSLRRQHISFSMVQSLRTDAIQVTMELMKEESDEEDIAIRKVGAFGKSVEAPSNRLVSLTVTLKNQNESPQLVSLSLTVEPAEHVLYDGVLAGIPLGRLNSQETKVFQIGLAFIAEGQFLVQSQAFTTGEAGGAVVSGLGELNIKVVGDSLLDAAMQDMIIS